MLRAANRGEGENICAPDVCRTPPPNPPGIPRPYRNKGAHSQAENFSPNVFVCSMNALHIMSKIPSTTGDEPGILGPGPMREGAFQVGNPIVRVNMIPGVNMTCPATGNKANAKGAALVPDTVNVFYTYAASPPDRPLRA